MLNRLFIIAVAAAWLLPASAQAAVPDLELRIDPLSGAMRIVALSGTDPLPLTGYTVRSNPANLPLENVIDPLGWNSLTDQSVPDFEEVVPAGQELTQITELDFTGSMAFSPATEVSLGNAYNTASGSEDLTFQYSQAGDTNTIFGNVLFGLAPLEVRVSRFSGLVRIVNPDGVDTVNLTGYTIRSNPANLPLENVIDPLGWNSLTDQSVPGFEEVVPAGQELTQITELNFAASFKAFTPGAVVSLGNVYDTTSGSEDLTFQYSQTSTADTTFGGVIFEAGGLRLRVNKSTGRTEIVNSELAGVDFAAYVIQSAAGLLDNGNAAWNSLEDQGVTGWEEAASSSNDLSELNFTSSSVIASAGSLNLGNPYTGGNAGVEDLTFEYNLTGSLLNLESVVEYIIAGDMDGDGDVDTVDAGLFVQALVARAAYDANGFTNLAGFLVDADSVGDVNDNGTFDLGDLGAFSGLLGGPASASASAVPEPASGGLLIAGLGLLALVSRRRKEQ